MTHHSFILKKKGYAHKLDIVISGMPKLLLLGQVCGLIILDPTLASFNITLQNFPFFFLNKINYDKVIKMIFKMLFNFVIVF
jgi:hypothetical protein